MKKNWFLSFNKGKRNSLFLLGGLFAVAVLGVLAFFSPPFQDYKASGLQPVMLPVTSSGGGNIPVTNQEGQGSFGIVLNAPFGQGDVKYLGKNSYTADSAFTTVNTFLSQQVQRSTAQRTTETPAPPAIDCTQNDQTLLLDDAIVFRNVRWQNTRNGQTGCGFSIPHLKKTGHFWFFNPENIELTCKALNGVANNGYYWVFCGTLTNLRFWMDAIDNANPENMKTLYVAGGNPVTSLIDNQVIAPGSNTPARFESYYSSCGGRFQLAKNSTGIILLNVEDEQGDAVSVTAQFDASTGITVTPDWSNPVQVVSDTAKPNAAPAKEIKAYFSVPDKVASYRVFFEVTDNKTLVYPSSNLCVIDINAV